MPKPTIVDFSTLFTAAIVQPLCDLAWDVFGSDTEDRPVNTVDEARKKLKAVSLAGDTMTGPLTLPATDPTLNNHAARKAYVDSKVQEINNTFNTVTKSQNGWWRDESTGFMIQWGAVAGAANSVVDIIFPLAFPSFCAGVNCSSNHVGWLLTVPVYTYTLAAASARTVGTPDGVPDQFRSAGPLGITYIAYGW